jgi:hypothetical protein
LELETIIYIERKLQLYGDLSAYSCQNWSEHC